MTLSRFRVLVTFLLTLGLLSLGPTTAQAQWTRAAKEAFSNFLGWGKKTAPAPHLADQARPAAKKLNYDEAVKNGEIFPRMFDEAADPFNTIQTQGLFQSLRTKDLVKTIGQEEAVLDVAATVRSTLTPGFVLTGSRGSGKTQVLNSLEYSFRRQAERNPESPKAHIIRIASDTTDFQDIQAFEQAAKALAQTKEFQRAGTIVFYFDDLKVFAKSDNGPQGLRHSLDVYTGILQRLQKQGQSVKLAFEGDQSAVAAALDGTSIGSRLKRIVVKETESVDDLVSIIKLNMNLALKDKTIQVSDQDISRLVSWIKRYAPGDGVAQKALRVLDNTISKQHAFFSDDMFKMTDEVAEGLKKDLEFLRARLDRAQSSSGAYARELRETLPEEISRTETRLKEAEQEYQSLLSLREKLLRIETKSSPTAEDVAEYRQLIDLAAQISARRMAVEVAEETGARLKDILRFTGRMTLEEFRKALDQEIYGQPIYKKAIMKAADRIIRAGADSRLIKSDEPIFTMLAWGPPGTGKTSGLHLLGELVDGNLLLPGAKYSTDISVNSLFGADPSYVGYEAGGFVTNFVQKMHGKLSLLIFDEIESMAPVVFENMANMVNPARLPDGKGVMTDFTKTVQVYTTNAGWETVEAMGRDAHSLSRSEAADLMRGSAKSSGQFIPKFMDRLDEIIYVGRPLAEDSFKILNKFVRSLNSKPLLEDNMLKVRLTQSAQSKLIQNVELEKGTAREIKRQLNRHVETPISQLLRPADEVVAKPLEKALDQGHYIDELTGEVRTLKIQPGDLIELDFNDAQGFVFRVIE